MRVYDPNSRIRERGRRSRRGRWRNGDGKRYSIGDLGGPESFKRTEWSTFRGPSESRSHGRPNCIQTLPIKLARSPFALARPLTRTLSCICLARDLPPLPSLPHPSPLFFSLPLAARETKSGSSRIRGILFGRSQIRRADSGSFRPSRGCMLSQKIHAAADDVSRCVTR